MVKDRTKVGLTENGACEDFEGYAHTGVENARPFCLIRRIGGQTRDPIPECHTWIYQIRVGFGGGTVVTGRASKDVPDLLEGEEFVLVIDSKSHPPLGH